MVNYPIRDEVAEMPIVRTQQSKQLVREKYLEPNEGKNKVLISYHIMPRQKSLIDELSKVTGKGKAQVMRDIIDEWCEAQLKDCD